MASPAVTVLTSGKGAGGQTFTTDEFELTRATSGIRKLVVAVAVKTAAPTPINVSVAGIGVIEPLEGEDLGINLNTSGGSNYGVAIGDWVPAASTDTEQLTFTVNATVDNFAWVVMFVDGGGSGLSNASTDLTSGTGTSMSIALTASTNGGGLAGFLHVGASTFTAGAGFTELAEIDADSAFVFGVEYSQNYSDETIPGTAGVSAFWTAHALNLLQNPILPNRTTDVPFLQSNDRYQVVACVKAGTSTTTSQFRYWNASAPAWDLALEADTQYPSFHTLDEDSTYPVASVETPFKSIKTGQENQIQGVYVEFYVRPTSLSETLVTSGYPVGFTCRIEGISVPDYSRTVGTAYSSGVVVSDSQTYTSTAGVQASETWPNLRTAFLPCRMPGKIRAARVIVSDIHLVSIRRVQLMGKLTPGRDA